MFDHAQSARLGQTVPLENPGIQLVTLETLPEVAYRGQLVYRIDDDFIQVYDGVAWQNPAYTAGINGSTQTFIGANEPAADNTGDLWLNTTDFQLYVWDGFAWQHTTVNQDRLYARTSLDLAHAILARLGGNSAHVVIFYSTTAPTNPVEKDIWVNTVSNTVSERIGGTWVVNNNPAFTTPVNAAAVERSIHDGLIEVYFDAVTPTGLGPADVGDIWIDSAHGLLIRAWNGAQWVELQVTGDQIANGAVGGDQIADVAVNTRHIVDTSIVTSKLANNVITNEKLTDFAVAARNVNTLTHVLY